MQFRDLRENVSTTPVYEAHVLVRGEIALDRAWCLNETETEGFLRARLTEISPLGVNRVTVNHKERRGGTSIWEAEVALQGRVQIDKPIPREELQSLVKDIVQRAGFEKSDVQVRGLQKVGNAEPQKTDFREFSDMARSALRDPARRKEPLKREEILQLKKGDKVILHRGGFREEAEIVEVDESDDTAEVRSQYSAASEWIPFRKIQEVVRKKLEK